MVQVTNSNNTNPKICEYLDSNNIKCQHEITKKTTWYTDNKFEGVYCNKHSEICYRLQKFKAWEKAQQFLQNYVYCGSHWEKCDEHGPIDIYHYISKNRLGTRQVEELNKWDYDEEIWLRDDIWSYCGPYPTYPEPDWLTEDFESKLVADAMNN